MPVAVEDRRTLSDTLRWIERMPATDLDFEEDDDETSSHQNIFVNLRNSNRHGRNMVISFINQFISIPQINSMIIFSPIIASRPVFCVQLSARCVKFVKDYDLSKTYAWNNCRINEKEIHKHIGPFEYILLCIHNCCRNDTITV